MAWMGVTMLFALLAVMPAQMARGEAPVGTFELAQKPADVLPLAAVLRRIGTRYPGRALDAQMSDQRGQIVYRVKWLGQNGQVRHVTADARTGRILDVR